MSSAFCSKSYRCKNENWCAKDYNPEPYDYECFEPMTNADKIRQMSDEELARFVAKAQADILRTVGMALKYPGDLVRDCDLEDATDDWLDWLKQEVESNG